MKKLNVLLKFSVLFLFLAGIFSSCDKSEESGSTNTAASEALLISKWKAQMKSTNVAYDSTATKIFYILDKTNAGPGAKVATGNTVTVKYTGAFMDGTIFDSSNSFTFVHKGASSRMIPGWEESIQLLNEGAKGTFLIPSSLAYGTTGYGSIPPYSPLFFTIEVVVIK